MGGRSRVLITDPIGGDARVIADCLAAAGIDVTVPDGTGWRDGLSEADALIVNLAVIGPAEIERMARCRVIARLGIGVDGVAVPEATDRGIWVTNVPNYCTDEVAEHTLALILSLQRRLRAAQADLAAGTWNQLAYRGIHKISETTLGLLGLGQLGLSVARKAMSLGYRVLAHDPAASVRMPPEIGLVSFGELLRESDILSLHLPLLPATRNIMDAEAIARMKPGGLLVNTSRGGLVDESALIAALDRGHLAGAALDTFSVEPLPATCPLHHRPDLLLTPHIAFLSEESLVSLQEQAATEVMRVLDGQAPLHPVNRIERETG